MARDRIVDRVKRKARSTSVFRNGWTRTWGDLREKERYGFVERPQYAYGVFRAADVARYFGSGSVTVCEFGVASGDGLMNLVELSELVGRETGITFRVVGFDTGSGLPRLQGYKDHPEIWSGGDFPMVDREDLLRRTGGRAEVIFGDIADTVDAFVDSLDRSCPLGFASVDVDIYSGASSALRCLVGPPETLLPAVSMYFDDVGFFFANDWCGELAAIREFNEANALRKIDQDRSLASRASAPWHGYMYVCHALDHPDRARPGDRSHLTIPEHHELMMDSHLY